MKKKGNICLDYITQKMHIVNIQQPFFWMYLPHALERLNR